MVDPTICECTRYFWDTPLYDIASPFAEEAPMYAKALHILGYLHTCECIPMCWDTPVCGDALPCKGVPQYVGMHQSIHELCMLLNVFTLPNIKRKKLDVAASVDRIRQGA